MTNKAEKKWARTQRIRTTTKMPFEAVLADTAAASVYQGIASKALHLKRLGLCPSAIAPRLGVTAKTVVKALAWLVKQNKAEQLAPNHA